MNPYRKERVGSVVREIVSSALLNRLKDPRISALTTITRVVMSGDLLLARVFVSVPGGETEERKTLLGLQHAVGFLQRVVAEELNIRQCPQLRFEIDESLKKVRHTLEILDRNRREHPEWAAEESGKTAGALDNVKDQNDGDDSA